MTDGRRRLAEYLKRSKLKQYELADRLGLHTAHLSQILHGQRRPGLPIALRIETETGVPVRSWVSTGRGKTYKSRKALSRNTLETPVS